MPTAEELEAELKVVQLEEQLKTEKAGGGATRETKEALREARRVYREGRTAAAEGGDAVVAPEAIETEGSVQ